MPRTLITPPPVSAGQRIAALISVVAGGTFVLLLGSLHVVQPELDPRWRFISEYALGRAGWLMTAAFVTLAVSLLAAVVALARAVRTWPGRVGLVLLVVAAVGVLVAAVFPTDPITAPVEAQTTAGRLHNLGASLDWSPVGMLLLAWSLGRTTTWRPWRTRLLVAAAVPAVLTLVFTGAAAAAGGHFGPGTYAGLVGRLMLASYLGWFVTVAVALHRAPVAASSPVSAAAGSAGA
jgi:Protein of unknown function (DUF998)